MRRMFYCDEYVVEQDEGPYIIHALQNLVLRPPCWAVKAVFLGMGTPNTIQIVLKKLSLHRGSNVCIFWMERWMLFEKFFIPLWDGEKMVQHAMVIMRVVVAVVVVRILL
jgi:hypothetical protein